MNRIKILVVENEQIVAEDIKFRLKRLGYAVSGIALSGEEAIKKAEEIHPDLVLMDIVLEGKMDGTEAASAISSRFNIPVVYLTAYADDKTLERAKITEPFGFILKPYEDRELLSIIEIALYKHKTEKALKASKASFHNIVDKSVDGIIIVDRDGIVRFVNQSAENVFGYKAKEFIGEMFGFPVITGKSTEIDIIRSGGKPGTGEMHVVETEWEDEPANLILIRDITERTRIAKIKDEFITTVSHEMRTPLSITKEAISLVLDKVHGEINEQQNRTLSIGKNNIDRLARIINSLLDISKIEAGKVELKKTKVDVAGTIETVVSSFESKAKEKNLELRIKFPGEGIYIYADEDRTVQVLSNLVDNAIKFTSEGFIEISVQENENAVEYTVADTGIGIPKEDLPNVFDKFKQFGRKEGPGEKGTGLGLSIVKSIVELHNGKIRVESAVGKGTKFTFSLPKWSSEEMLKQYLFDAIRDAKEKETHFSVIMISILRFNELIEDRSEKAKEILKKLEELIKNALRRSSDMVIATNSGEILFILPETEKDDATSVLERVKEELRQYLSMKEDLKGKIDLSTGVISYPDEAKEEKDILTKIRQAAYGQKILLIEDEPEQIEMIKGRLGARSYQVIAAGNAESGIKLAQEERPDLILMDMILPGMHGLEAAQKLKEIPETKEIPIIAFTAMTVHGFKELCFQEGISDFIKKPYESKELHEKIEKNIRKKHERVDEVEDLEKKPEEKLSESDTGIQRKQRPKIEKVKEKLKKKLNLSS